MGETIENRNRYYLTFEADYVKVELDLEMTQSGTRFVAQRSIDMPAHAAWSQERYIVEALKEVIAGDPSRIFEEALFSFRSRSEVGRQGL